MCSILRSQNTLQHTSSVNKRFEHLRKNGDSLSWIQHWKLYDLREKNQNLNMKALEGPQVVQEFCFSQCCRLSTHSLKFFTRRSYKQLSFSSRPRVIFEYPWWRNRNNLIFFLPSLPREMLSLSCLITSYALLYSHGSVLVLPAQSNLSL